MENEMLYGTLPDGEDLESRTVSFHLGTACDMYELLGAHRCGDRVVFRAWLPMAESVSVVGDFNAWCGDALPMQCITQGGIWEASVPQEEVKEGQWYKFRVCVGGSERLLADPYAYRMQLPPDTASEFRLLDGFSWRDAGWLSYRERELSRADVADRAVNVYRVSLAAWRRHEDGTPLCYGEAADELSVYAKQMGYTHVELTSLCVPTENDGIVTGAFAPTAQHGTPTEFMRFIDRMHEAGIGVILDWTLAEHFQRDISPEEQSFLLSCAAFWCTAYHVDGLCCARTVHTDMIDRMLAERFPDVLSVTNDAREERAAEIDAPVSPARLRTRLLRIMTTPGKKRLVMGCELGEIHSCRDAVDWSLTQEDMHAHFQAFVSELNHFYLENPALWEESDGSCFEMLDADDGILAYRRRALDGQTLTVVICTDGTEARNISVAVPEAGAYAEVFCTDDVRFGGTGNGCGVLESTDGEPIRISLRPDCAVVLARKERVL